MELIRSLISRRSLWLSLVQDLCQNGLAVERPFPASVL